MGDIGMYYNTRVFTVGGCVDFFSYIVSLVILFFRFKKFQKNSVLKNALLLCAHLAGLYAAMLVLGGLAALVTDIDTILNYLPKLIVLILYTAFFSDYKWQSKIIMGVMLYAIHHCLIEIGASFSGVLSSLTSDAIKTRWRYILTCTTVIAAIFLRIFNIDRCKRVPKSAVVEALCFSIVGVVMAIFRSNIYMYFMQFENTEMYLYSLFPALYATAALICLIIYIFFCYFFMVRNIRTNEENNELNKKVMRLENNNEMIAVNENNLKLMRKLRHDIKKQYSLIKVMLEEKQYDKLDEYFNELIDSASNPLSQVDTGNSFFDMVLNLEISKAKANDIDISTKLVVPPELPLSDTDICGLLTNLMDNAIEACEKIEGAPKTISVSSQIVHDYFILSVSNTISPETAGGALLLQTDKQDKELHGLGSKIIDDIVKKYNGQINRRVENNIFTVDIMIEIGEDAAE